MERVWQFPNRVIQGDDGAYRWTYSLKATRNDEPLWTMIKICLAVALPIVLIMTVMTWQYLSIKALLWALLFLAGMVGFPALIWKLAPPNPSFKLTEDAIEAWPKGKGVNIHTFGGVKRVILERGIDRIRLCWRVTSLHIYVPREDYDFVRDYIIARVSDDAEILYE